MKVIRPTTITDAMLVSDIPETPDAAYNAATAYGLDARVSVANGAVLTSYKSLQAANTGHAPAASPAWWKKVADTYALYVAGTTYAKDVIVTGTATHRLYQSLQPANTGHALTDGAWWLDIGPTNRWAMLDQAVGTLTTGVGSFSLTLAPGEINGIGILDTNAEVVTVTMIDGGTVIYNRSQSTNTGGAAITDWYLYFFEEIGVRTSLTFLDLPLYATATVKITFTGSDSAAPIWCGTLAVGRTLAIGDTETGPKSGITDFSKKDTDTFGATTVVERPYSDRITLNCKLLTENVSSTRRQLAALRATPCFWIASEKYDALITYGFYKDFEFTIAYTTISYCSLTIEGLA